MPPETQNQQSLSLSEITAQMSQIVKGATSAVRKIIDSDAFTSLPLPSTMPVTLSPLDPSLVIPPPYPQTDWSLQGLTKALQDNLEGREWDDAIPWVANNILERFQRQNPDLENVSLDFSDETTVYVVVGGKNAR
jgi:hypothetical protein